MTDTMSAPSTRQSRSARKVPTRRKGTLRSNWRQFRTSPLVSRDLWNQLRDYNRPDFHPDERDTSQPVEQWRDELFGEHGTLDDELVANVATER